MKECDIFWGSKHTLTLSYIFSGTFRLCVYISCCHSRRHMYKSSFAMCPTLMSLQIVECAETFVTQQTPVLSYHPSGFSCECTELLPAYRLCHTNDIRKISLPCALSSAYTDCWTDWMTCHTSDSCTVSLHCVLCRARRGCATLQTVCHKRHNCTAYPVHPRGLSCNEDADVPTEWTLCCTCDICTVSLHCEFYCVLGGHVALPIVFRKHYTQTVSLPNELVRVLPAHYCSDNAWRIPCTRIYPYK